MPRNSAGKGTGTPGKRGMRKGTHLKLTERHHKFAFLYFTNGGNATKAAREAGFSQKCAGEVGSGLLDNELVQAEIKKHRDKAFRKLHMTKDELLASIARTVRFDVRNLFDELGNMKMPHEMDADTAMCISGIDVEELKKVKRKGDDPDDEVRNEIVQIRKVRTTDRTAAQNMLMRHYNLYREEQETAGGALGQRMAELVLESQQAGGGVAGLIARNKPKVPKPLPKLTEK